MAPIATHTRLWHTGETLLSWHCSRRSTPTVGGSGWALCGWRRAESGAVVCPIAERRTLRQQRVDRGGRPLVRSFKAAKRNFADKRIWTESWGKTPRSESWETTKRGPEW